MERSELINGSLCLTLKLYVQKKRCKPSWSGNKWVIWASCKIAGDKKETGKYCPAGLWA